MRVTRGGSVPIQGRATRLLILLTIVASALPCKAAGGVVAVKAGYLVKIAPFVAWPAHAFAAADSPLQLCITGIDPFGPALADAVKGQQVEGHPMTLDHVATAQELGACHILFVGRSPQPAEWRSALAGRPVLVVTDGSEADGMIEFVKRAGHVRFTINAAAAAAAGLQISSKLLELAVKVER